MASSTRTNPFIASGAIGMCIDGFNGDKFDHAPYGFVGGGYMRMVRPNGRPIETTPTPPDTSQWGAAGKKAVKDNYLTTSRRRTARMAPRHRSHRATLALPPPSVPGLQGARREEPKGRRTLTAA